MFGQVGTGNELVSVVRYVVNEATPAAPVFQWLRLGLLANGVANMQGTIGCSMSRIPATVTLEQEIQGSLKYLADHPIATRGIRLGTGSGCSQRCMAGTEERGEAMSKMSKTSYPGVYQRRNGGGLVHVIMYRTRKPDGTWKQIAETIKTDSVKKARTELANRLHDVNGGEALPTNITFQQFVSEYWEPHCTGKLKPSTQKSHRSNLKHHILPELRKAPGAERYLNCETGPT